MPAEQKGKERGDSQTLGTKHNLSLFCQWQATYTKECATHVNIQQVWGVEESGRSLSCKTKHVWSLCLVHKKLRNANSRRCRMNTRRKRYWYNSELSMWHRKLTPDSQMQWIGCQIQVRERQGCLFLVTLKRVPSTQPCNITWEKSAMESAPQQWLKQDLSIWHLI